MINAAIPGSAGRPPSTGADQDEADLTETVELDRRAPLKLVGHPPIMPPPGNDLDGTADAERARVLTEDPENTAAWQEARDAASELEHALALLGAEDLVPNLRGDVNVYGVAMVSLGRVPAEAAVRLARLLASTNTEEPFAVLPAGTGRRRRAMREAAEPQEPQPVPLPAPEPLPVQPTARPLWTPPAPR